MKKEKNEVVYDNQLNRLSFKGFSEYDLNFFMVICERMKDLGEELQRFDYDTLMDLLEWDKSKSIDVFHKDLMRMSERLRHVGATIEVDEDHFCAFNLFSTFDGYKKKRTLEVQINPRFKHILNQLSGKFTTFELAEYIRLDGKYSKLLYQHLKQYTSTGWWQVSVDDIRRELAIPDSMKTMQILNKVINPTVEVIKTCKGFADLDVEVLRSRRRGRAIEGFKFKWSTKNSSKHQRTLDDWSRDLEVQKKKQKAKQTTFHQFEEHEYDMDVLENKLLEK